MSVGTAQDAYDHAVALINEYHPEYSEVLDGGTGPNYFDCSGWVMVNLNAIGIPIGRNTTDEFAETELIPHSDTPQFMALGWYQVPGDAGSVPGIPDHVVFYIDENTILEAPHTGEPVGFYPQTVDSPDEYLLCWGIPPYASATPTPPPTPSEENEMPVSQVIQFKPNQQDVFQVSLDTLWHKWMLPGKGWNNENVGEVALDPSGKPVTLPKFPDQIPMVTVLNGQVLVTVQDSTGKAWYFAQSSNVDGWGVNELP